jgi:quercetin dioxygenase-like cupin family protein
MDTRSKIGCGVVVLGLALSATAEESPMRVELRNDRVNVMRIRLKPHQTIPMHEVPPHLAIWLTDGTLKMSFPDGRTETHRFHAGQVEWVEIGKHSGENIGRTPIEFLAVEELAEPK